MYNSLTNLTSAAISSAVEGIHGLFESSGTYFLQTLTHTFPSIITEISKNSLEYKKYSVTTSGTDVNFKIGFNYNTGLWGENRTGIGAFYFIYLGQGHIGAFYFGTLSETIEVLPLELTITILPPICIGGVSYIVRPSTLELFTTLLEPTLKKYSNVKIDFIATPRKGTSPLEVDFEANVTLLADIGTAYKINNYRWFFDYDRNPSVYETTTINTNTHTFTGYQGKQYTIRVCVILETI
jgi:hypothetical protein